MRLQAHIAACVIIMMLLACLPFVAAPAPPREKNVWNYDGGLLLQTNGAIPSGPCFRISGRLTAPGFFDNLKRFDTEAGTTYRRGSEQVTKFPERVFLSFIVYDHYDQTCPPRIENTGSAKYLTRALMSTLRLSLYWKRGVELRPVDDVQPKNFSVDPVTTRSVSRSPDPPPQKWIWSYEFTVPSAGAALDDSLVLILRTPDGHIAARVAARM